MNEAQKPTLEPINGFYVQADFDRLITKVKKNQEGQEYNAYEIGMILRTEESTLLYAVKTKNPERWRSVKPGTPVKIRVTPRAFKDFLYFTIAE